MVRMGMRVAMVWLAVMRMLLLRVVMNGVFMAVVTGACVLSVAVLRHRNVII